MSYLFDASAIYKALTGDRIETLAGNFTLRLASYELGNSLWKEHSLRGHIDIEEMLGTTLLIKRILATMKTLDIDCHEQDIAEVASKLRITFYDASYAFQARQNGVSLVSEDEELRRKAKNYITTMRLAEVAEQAQ